MSHRSMNTEAGDSPERYIGLGFDEARQRVLSAFKVSCHRKSNSTRTSFRFDAPTKLLIISNVVAIVVFLISYGLTNHLEFRAGLFSTALILAIALGINIWTLQTYHKNTSFELSRTLSNIFNNYEAYLSVQRGHFGGSCDARSNIPSGHSQLSIVNTFREGKWIKIPLLLLAEGDIIALMGGDITPCRVYELLPMKKGNQSQFNIQYNESLQQQWILGDLLTSGTKILINKTNRQTKSSSRPNVGETRKARSKTIEHNNQRNRPQVKPDKTPQSRDSKTNPTERHRSLGSESTEILRLAGDIRCFLVAETPIEDFVDTIYQRHDPHKNSDTFIMQLMTRVCTEGISTLKCLPIILLVCIIIRLAIFSETRHYFQLTVFSAIGSTICLIVPSAIPMILITAEAVGTAEILSTLEVALHKNEECKRGAPHHSSALNRTAAHNAQTSSPRPLELNPILSQSEDNEFIDEDIDIRAEDKAEETDDKVEYRRFFRYIYEILCNRLFGLRVEKTSNILDTKKASRGPPLLPIPLASLNMVDQLGAITMVCFVDDDVICENYSVTEEIFLLTEKHDDLDQDNGDADHPSEGKNGKPRIKGTVLDLHANPEATGSRFENPMWWKFLPSLKPLGVDALLTYKHTAEKTNGGIPTLPSTLGTVKKVGKPQKESKRSIIERALVRHIQQTLPLEALRELAEEIGFSDDDMQIFSKVLDVNVIASGLENAHLLEDNHQWGQEESRRRGSLLPQLRGGVYEDTRGKFWYERSVLSFKYDLICCIGGVQMMGLGDPTIILNYCREYWDGSTCSIAPLSAVDRQEVLNVYERWKLEDFDVVAFCYTPMPVSSLVYFRQDIKEDPDNTGTLYFVDPTPVEHLTGKKKKEVKIEDKPTTIITVDKDNSTAKCGHDDLTSSQLLEDLESSDVLLLTDSMHLSENGLDDVGKEIGLHVSSEAWDVDNSSEMKSSLRHNTIAIKRSASDSELSSYPVEKTESLNLDWSKSLNSAMSESFKGNASASRAMLELDDESKSLPSEPMESLTSKSFFRKSKKGYEVLTSPKSEAAGEMVYSTLHTPYSPILQSGSIQFDVPEDEQEIDNNFALAAAEDEEVEAEPDSNLQTTELLAGSMLVKTLSLDRAIDSLPTTTGIKRRNSISAPSDHSLEETEVVREKRSYSFTQPPTLSVLSTPLERHSNSGIADVEPEQRKRPSSMKREKKASSKAWANNNAATRMLKQQRRNALRQLWTLLRQQIFLGMAASSVPVRRDVPNTKEDLDVAGIRFVYFSAQNMKRSKPVAEKLGIPFDWNCAISLRNLDSEESHDPHRHISSYADWDVLARMPHGIEAIKEHLLNVDNVPLLVSLFTDATPETIKSMVEVFRENGETVLTVGAGYRAYNQHVYNVSNLAASVSYLPNILPFIPSEEKDIFSLFPAFSAQSLTRSDLRLAFDLVGLGTVNLLQLRSVDPSLLLTNIIRDVDPSLVEHVHLSVLLETIRKGRVLLLNKQQALAFFLIAVVSLGLWNLAAQAIPLSVSPTCPPPIALVFSLLYLPSICLAMLFNDGHENVMKNTPRKALLHLRPKDTSRFFSYLSGRVGTVAGGIFLTGFFSAASVFRVNKSIYHSLGEFHRVFENSDDLVLDFRRFDMVQDMMAHAALLGLLGQSLTLLVRGQQPLKDFPWPSYYVEYYFTLFILLGVHALFMALRVGLRNCDISGQGARWLSGVDCNHDNSDHVSYSDITGFVWAVLFISFVANIAVGFYVNSYDGHFYRRYLQFLRLEFDTRLGMHSPR